MGDVRRPISYSSRRRPRSSIVDGGESSFSRKRARSPAAPRRLPLPRQIPLRHYSDDDYHDDFIINDGSHRWDNDDDREEDEQQRGTQDERGSSPDDGFLGGSESDADHVVQEAGEEVEEQPPAEEDDSDDDNRPMSVVLRARTSTAPASNAGCSTGTTRTVTTSPPPPSSSSSSDRSSVIRNVTVENSSAFDCSICYHPLKSPIFQCTVGHVVCSPCHDKLWQATNCHVCRVPIPDGYFRCNAMEQVVDSIRVPCPHAAHGCSVRPAYHERDDHARTCPHKPCHCPVEGCGFAGPLQTTLLKHFATVHGWPCSVRSTGDSGVDVCLLMGFNVVTVTDEENYTLVLKVKQEAPVCNAITAFCIHPSHTGIVRLGISYYRRWRQDSSGLFISKYLQSSQLDVVCTDLSNGIPGPSSCYPFLVSRWPATPGGEDGDDISITINYVCRNIVLL